MAFSIVGTPTSAAGTGPTLSITKPTGVASGDVLVLYVMTETASTAPATPSGFTLIGDKAATTQAMRVTAFYKVAGASEPTSYSATYGTGGSWIEMALIAVRGASGTPLDVSASNTDTSASTTVTAASITTTQADELLWFAADWNGGETLPTPPTGYTQQLADVPNGLFIYTNTQGAAGSTGAVNATLSASDTWVTWHIGLLPAGGAGTAWNQSLSDTLASLDTRTSQPVKQPLDALSVFDGWRNNVQSAQFANFSSVDVPTKNVVHRPPTDSVSSTDLRTAAKGSLWTIVDKISSSDALTQRNVSKLLVDLLAETDTQRFAATHRLADFLVLTEVLSKLPAHLLQETVSSRDTVANTLTQGGQSLVKTLSDSQSATDRRVALLVKQVAENLVFVDGQSWQVTHRLLDSFSQTEKVVAGRALLQALQDWLVSTDLTQETKQQALAGGLLTVLSLTISSLLGVALAISTSASLVAVLGAISHALALQPGSVTTALSATPHPLRQLVVAQLRLSA